jgi:heme oxygenase (biliverdin-IX-beta and delta-forming)
MRRVQKLLDQASVTQVLRAATTEAHERLHHSSMLGAFEAGTTDAGGYADIMQVFLDYYRAVDPVVISAMAEHAGGAQFSYIPRAELFARDIAALPILPSLAPVEYHAPAISNAAELAGVIYVIEGSILGGAGLDRAARTVLRDGTVEGRSYWQWCRSNAGKRWKEARSFIDALVCSHAGQASAVAAATTHFDLLQTRFSEAAAARQP